MSAACRGSGVLGPPDNTLRQRRRKSKPWALAARLRAGTVPVLGVLAAAAVGYTTSKNPEAGPAHVAVVLRVLIIGTLIAAGLYARTSGMQARMGARLTAGGFFAAAWLLNGSAGGTAFSIGFLLGGAAPAVFCYLMLAYPSGSLARREWRFLAVAGGTLMAAWTLTLLTTAQPPFRTPLLRCPPGCPPNIFFIGTTGAEVTAILKALILLSWTSLAIGTFALLYARLRSASAPVRRLLIPVAVAAGAHAFFLLAYYAAWITGSRAVGALGAAYVEVALAVPLAILIGLAGERLFMGQALAEFVNELVRTPRADPTVLMSSALNDPSLQIAYRRPAHGTQVDLTGSPVALPDEDATRAIAWIERERSPIAAVIYDARLADQERFVQAAGAVATLRLEQAQLEADLRASTRELAASRIRLVEAADAERQRIERDLHDGIQQHLLGLRLKLDLAAEALKAEPQRGEQLITSIGQQMDDLLAELRALARGIYPSLLTEQGVGEALKSVALLSATPVSVRTRGIRRYDSDVEVAVYFCCLEAVQNVTKHAGEGARATVTLQQDGDWLRFAIRDTGKGFDAGEIRSAHGLLNMRDRIEAVGGTLSVDGGTGRGATVIGRVPVDSRALGGAAGR